MHSPSAAMDAGRLVAMGEVVTDTKNETLVQ
jgi:hypothetical protein